jgi:SulP family sulfate permease
MPRADRNRDRTLLARAMPNGVRLAAWARPYDRANLRPDVLAGITMAAILVPQAMAYALLAGLPPEVGLYAGTVPVAVYAIFGSSLHLSVGPVALVSLLTLSAVSSAAPPGKEVETAGLLALMVGATSLVMGLARIGFLVNFISRPVLLGFTAAAALIIAASQLNAFAGVDAERGDDFRTIVSNFVGALDTVNGATLALGLAALATLLLWRGRAGIPGPLLVAVGATLAVLLLGLEDRGVEVVGEIPRGLPGPTLGGIDAGALALDLLPAALVITLIGYLESIAIARTYAHRLGYRVRPSQEMIAVGLSNASAGAIGGYPVSGSFSRTAANVHAGARTPVSKLISAGIVLLVVLGLTPLLEPLPDTALAAIILVAVAALVDPAEITRVIRLHPRDAVAMALAFALTLALGVEIGLVIAVLVSIALLGRRGLRSPVSTPDVDGVPDHVAMVTVDGPLTFANHRSLRRTLAGIVERRGVTNLGAAVLDLRRATGVDASAEYALAGLIHDYSVSGIQMHLAAASGQVDGLLNRSGALAGLPFVAHRGLSEAIRAASAVTTRGRPG